jgi:RecA-family ATPase
MAAEAHRILEAVMNDSFRDFIKDLKQSQQKAQQRDAELIAASDVKPKSKDWLWEGHLLRGALELLSGLPGLGKSQVQINLVACVTAGLPWPDGTAGMKPANVIMLTAEDVLDQEVIPRLIAAKADLKRVHILKCIKSDGAGRQFLLGEDLDVLEKAIIQIGDVALVTIDPITAYMGGKIDSHKATEVRSQLGPLKDFAERMNVAISAITHPPKSSSQKAIDHFIGSQAFIAAGRIGHVCIEEIDEKDKKTGRILFTHAKHNPSIQMPTLAYQVVAAIIGQDEESQLPITAPHVVWDKDSVDITADEAVWAAAGLGKQRGKQEAVQTFLCEILKSGQPVAAKDIIAAAGKHGFSERQLRTARAKLHVVCEQRADGWWWQLVPF